VPHIELPDLPGITALLTYRPETARPLMALAEVLLRDDNSLTRGERELIAAYVSTRNECGFCAGSHRAFSVHQIDGGAPVVDSVLQGDLERADVSPKLRVLLAIAVRVQESGRAVTAADVDAARAAGATDVEIHDTVLIAAAFCMYNRYVDGLATWAPIDPARYDAAAALIAEDGYQRER
jgi:uncharacterized peroxidase-related enzyme